MSEKSATGNVVEFIPREEYERVNSPVGDLSTLASSDRERLRLPRELSRKQVMAAFMDAFELLGGVPRLVTWANEHPGDFYKLYAKLMPSSNTTNIGDGGNVTIIHVVPRGPLDE